MSKGDQEISGRDESMTDVRTAFQPYKTASGLYTNNPGGTSGNDILFSAEALICFKQHLPTNEFVHEAVMLAQAIRRECEIKDGLFARGNGYSQDQIGPDDLIGLGSISPYLASDCLDYLWRHFGYYKTGVNPHWLAPFMYRFPALIAHLNFGAGDRPNIFLRLAWCLSVAFSNRDDDQDSWILNSILVHTAVESKKLGFIEKAAIRQFQKKLYKRWGSIRACFRAYFGNSEHPVARFFTENIV